MRRNKQDRIPAVIYPFIWLAAMVYGVLYVGVLLVAGAVICLSAVVAILSLIVEAAVKSWRRRTP